MTREIAAHHAEEALSQDYGPALVLHPWVPDFSIVGLIQRATAEGPAKRAVEHVRGCATCTICQLCQVGERLAQRIARRKRRGRAA